jgi:SAM-dependent methyltransferase
MNGSLDLKFFFNECRHRVNSHFLLNSTEKQFRLTPDQKKKLSAINEACGALYGELLEAGYKDLMEITYPDLSFKAAYNNNFIESSHLRQARAWRRLRLAGPLTEQSLNVYYNQFSGMPYCGFQKLHNLSWISSRMEQFNYLEDRRDDRSRMSYLEFGGATGLLPIVASLIGFKNATNLEINSSAAKIGANVAQKLSLKLRTVDSPPIKETYDVISCHQVIEHFLDPSSLLNTIRGLLSEDGVLFMSHGYHLPAHPGHIPVVAPLEFEKFLNANGFYIADDIPSGTLVVRSQR